MGIWAVFGLQLFRDKMGIRRNGDAFPRSGVFPDLDENGDPNSPFGNNMFSFQNFPWRIPWRIISKVVIFWWMERNGKLEQNEQTILSVFRVLLGSIWFWNTQFSSRKIEIILQKLKCWKPISKSVWTLISAEKVGKVDNVRKWGRPNSNGRLSVRLATFSR